MKVSSIKISHFRGIPNELNLNITDKKGKAVSAIIFGDNGSGKSSIVDALEFGLQCRIEKSSSINNPTRPSILNHAHYHTKKAEINITFSDSSTYKREAYTELDEKKERINFIVNPNIAHQEFAKCPIVLRRHDILAYSFVETSKKQIYLMKNIYSVGERILLKNDPEVLKLKENYVYLKNKRRDLVHELSIHLEVNDEEVMHNIKMLDGYINNRVAPFSSKKYYSKNRKAKLKRVPDKIYTTILNLEKEIKNITSEIKSIDFQINQIINSPSQKIGNKIEEFKALLSEIETLLFPAFVQISNVNYVNNIKLSIGNQTDVSLDIQVELSSGKMLPPQKIFSEANYDLIILLLHISLFRACVKNGQAKFLILDDVLQSVDSIIRARFVEYILRELKDWQLIITCHDRLWLNQLKYMFNRVSHPFKEFHISRWDFLNGPKIEEMNYKLRDDIIDKALETKNPRLIAAACGVCLEMICQNLSVSLKTSIQRKYDDRYTLGDLWPGIVKFFKKSSLSTIINKIDSLILIRNILGCHYNEWADSMSDAEVAEFANNVRSLYDLVFCDNCGEWVSINSQVKLAECRCRTKFIEKS